MKNVGFAFKRVFLAMDVFIIASMWILLGGVEDGFNAVIAWTCLGAFYLMAVSLLVFPLNILRRMPLILSTEFAFSIFFFVIFFLPYQQHLLGILDFAESSRVYRSYPEQANRAMIVAVMVFAAFQFGTLLFSRPPVENLPKVRHQRGNLIIDIALPVTLFVTVISYLAFGLQSANTDRYGGEVTNGGPVADGLYAIILSICLIVITRIIVVLAQFKKLSIWNILGSVVVSGWALYILISGDRNNFLIIALSAAGGIAALVRKMGMVTVLCALFAAIAIYNIIEISRKDQSASLEEILMTDSASARGTKRESSFNNSTAATRAAFSVAESDPRALSGAYFLIGLGGIVPLARGYILSRGESTTTAEVLTEYMLRPGANWGVGTTMIADSYINFGLIGTILASLIVGLYIGYCRNRLQVYGLETVTAFLYIASIGLVAEMPRYALHSPIRNIIWGLLLILIFELTLGRKRTRAQPDLMQNNLRDEY